MYVCVNRERERKREREMNRNKKIVLQEAKLTKCYKEKVKVLI